MTLREATVLLQLQGDLPAWRISSPSEQFLRDALVKGPYPNGTWIPSFKAFLDSIRDQVEDL